MQHEAGSTPAWPITYADLAPYYDVAEQLMGTHGTAGMDPCEPPAPAPCPILAIGHDPEIPEIDQKLRAKGPEALPASCGHRPTPRWQVHPLQDL